MSRYTKLVLSLFVILGIATAALVSVSAASSTTSTPGTFTSARVAAAHGLKVGTLLHAPAKGPKGQRVKHYQWERRRARGGAWIKIRGATRQTYRVRRSDIGYVIRTAMVIAGSQGNTTVVTGPTPVIVGPLPVNTALPTISGTAQVNDTLTGTNGSWNYAIHYTYLWLLCNPNAAGGAAMTTTDVVGGSVPANTCSPLVISGTSTQETATTYTIQQGDIGFTIEFQVTAYNY